MATRNIVGNVPEPEELYGRSDLIDHLWRQIRGNNILLLAPRRFGKTGVMNHVLNQPKEGYLPVYLELEDVDSPAEFVWRLVKELMADLECDWYLVLDTRTNEYHFMLILMRDWWRRWYGSPRRKAASAGEK